MATVLPLPPPLQLLPACRAGCPVSRKAGLSVIARTSSTNAPTRAVNNVNSQNFKITVSSTLQARNSNLGV